MLEDIIGEPKKVEEYLNTLSYSELENYKPSDFALEFVNFIKLVEGGDPEDKTPVVHYRMLDNFVDVTGRDTINMCHRGIAKSTLKEYLIFYIGVFGTLQGLGKVPYALYVSDSIDNGIKKMRKSLEFRWSNSEFLRQMIPTTKFTDIRWEFINTDGNSFVVSGHGAKTGVRGTRENNSRPVLALLDDLVSDADARSPTIISDIEDTVSKAINYALHPKRRKVIWSGTPFNAKDPLYKAVETGAWTVNVFPVCEKFPCSRAEFRGSWEDRFTYDYVKNQYEVAVASGKIASFNQELMLRIMSEEDRILQEHDIQFFPLDLVLKNLGYYNIYITTDFATSEKTSGDFSVIFVWAYNHAGDWFLIDWHVKKCLMDVNIDKLFEFSSKYKPQQVGVEISGQQKGFISWIKREMLTRNIMFSLASENAGGQEGIRPVSDKYSRFKIVEPWFKQKKIYLPESKENDPAIAELLNELRLITYDGFKSKHDDCIDGVSQLGSLRPWKPSEDMGNATKGSDNLYIWGFDEDNEEVSGLGSYIV